jgi:hypothetical protein
MENTDRRNFLKMLGVTMGSTAVGAAAPALALVKFTGGLDSISFRAVAGVPAEPLAAYASYVLEGSVNPVARNGVLMRTVFAGSPEAMSNIAIPGLTRVIRVTDVRADRGVFYISGVIDDRSQLQKGESPTVDVILDRGRNTVRAPLIGSSFVMQIQH